MYYKQLCRKCQVGFNPYRVEAILCKVPLQVELSVFRGDFQSLAARKHPQTHWFCSPPPSCVHIPVSSSPSMTSGLLWDLLQLREEAEAHQHEEASPPGPVLSLQGHAAVLRRHLQLQIHRLSSARGSRPPLTWIWRSYFCQPTVEDDSSKQTLKRFTCSQTSKQMNLWFVSKKRNLQRAVVVSLHLSCCVTWREKHLFFGKKIKKKR